MTQQTNPNQNPPTDTQWALVERIKAWLSPPVFPDNDERTRRAAFINAFLLAAFVILIVFSFSLPWSTQNLLPAITIVTLVIALVVFGLINIRRGNVESTAYLVTIFAWLVIAGASAYFGGVSSPLFASFIVVILAAGLLIGTRAAVVFTTASILYGLFLLFLQNSEVLPEFQGNATSYMIRFSNIFVVATFLVYLANRNIFSALQLAEQAKDELEKNIDELNQIKTYLENDVEENTRQLEKRNRYLEAATQIALDTTTTSDMNEMLDLIVDQIAARFGFYHVGIFITDENSQWAILQSASSEGGRQMVAREHRLGVGKQGIVGYVTGIGQPRISQDIWLDRIHSVTQELPETRSEMALPLKVRQEIIGALDIQDNIPNAFSEEDISALQILANQIALAIENFRLSDQARERAEEVQRVYGEYSQRAWAETHRQKELAAYRFSSGDLIPLNDPEVSLESENKLEIPILIRGNQIGSIEIAKEDALSEWSSDEIELLQTLSEQLGIALDSARLFNETQLRATTEQIIGDINADIWESLEINSILRTTVEKLQKSLELPEVSIRMAPPATGQQTSGNGTPQDIDESN
jgi:GAF domain-containing protein